MSTTQNLKFIHLASGADAQHSSENLGAIIFEPKTGRIAVDGAKGLEYYGGNIKNATFEGKVLTLSFNKGEDIKLDFNDVASAEGMTTLLSGLRDKIDALRTDVTALQRASHTHANKTVLDGITSDKVTSWDAVAGAKGTYDTHVSNTDIHVTAADKTKWTGKQDALSTEQLAAANSGITATKVSTYEDHVGNTDIHVTTEDKAKWNAAEKNAKDYADGLAKNYDAAGAAAQALAEAKSYTDGKVEKINTDATALGTRVNTLETAVGKPADGSNAATGLHKDIADLAGLHANKTEGGKKTVAEEVTAGVNAKVGAIDGTVKNYVDAAKKAANDYTDGKVSDINAAAADLGGRVGTLETSVDALKTKVGDENSGLVKKVNTLIGEDADKSVRTISAEEVAKVVAGAPASYDTLKEIADWIASDTTGSAQMANDISALKTTVGKEAEGDSPATGLVKKVADNKSSIDAHAGRLSKLEALHAKDGQTMKSVATEVSEGIAGIAQHSETNDDKETKTADVVVTVTTAAGSVSGVAVDASILAGKVTAEKSRAEGIEKGLRTDVNAVRSDLGESDATASAATAFGRIKALEEKQTSGTLMWSRWD